MVPEPSSGDEIVADNGMKFVLGDLLATQGKPGCQDVRCTRDMRTGECMGWHCPRCGAPTSSQGHRCPRDQ